MQPIRSVIFVPGNRASMLERARSFDADVIMVDLEDSVPPGEKVNCPRHGPPSGSQPCAPRASA